MSNLFSIFNNIILQLEDEDQLVDIINELYSNNSEYSILYETVNFVNVSTEMMTNFIQIFSFDDLSKCIYVKMCERMKHRVIHNNSNNNDTNISERYIGKTFQFSEDKKFAGIIDYINKKNNGNISNDINITAPF